MSEGFKWYDIEPLLEYGAMYSLVYGQRSNGKTYSALRHCIKNFIKTGEQFVYLRRWDDEIKKQFGQTFFAPFENPESPDCLEKLTDGKWSMIQYVGRSFWFARKDEKTKTIVRSETPIGWALSLNTWEHGKGTSYPHVTTMVFDEFMTSKGHLPNEWLAFTNVISTVKRQRDNFKVIMLANSIQRYGCIYFSQMGLKRAQTQQQGTVDVYKFGEGALTIAVEWCETMKPPSKGKDWFYFDDPSSRMITTGAWEMARYPQLPEKYKPKEVRLTYWIVFDGFPLQCDIVRTGSSQFTYIFKIEEMPRDITRRMVIYTPEVHPEPNYARKITNPTLPIHKKIASFFQKEKVFYEDSDVGELVKAYVQWCRKDVIV